MYSLCHASPSQLLPVSMLPLPCQHLQMTADSSVEGCDDALYST